MSLVYRWLLCLYPAEFRREFGEEMAGVLERVSVDAARAGRMRRIRLAIRETAGLARGAFEEKARRSRGIDFIWRKKVMSSIRSRFRFPIAGITFMVLTLGLVLIAIRNAQSLSYAFAGPAYKPEHLSLIQTFGFTFVVTLAATVVILAVRHRLRRSGVSRLEEARTWPQQ